jgi:hypothetical protein
MQKVYTQIEDMRKSETRMIRFIYLGRMMRGRSFLIGDIVTSFRMRS